MSTPAALRVLCVEDDACIRLLAVEALRDAGFEVIEAGSGDEAMLLLADPAGVDILFTDVRMPGRLDGIDLAAEVRRDHPAMPVVVASGYANQIVSRLAALQPPPRFLSKPYRLDLMVDTLRDLTTPH